MQVSWHKLPEMKNQKRKPAAFLVPAAFLAALGSVRKSFQPKKEQKCPLSLIYPLGPRTRKTNEENRFTE
jgi:hypothetical protein